MATATTSTVIGLFPTQEVAERAVSALISAGFAYDNISVISGESTASRAEVPNLDPVLTKGPLDAGTGAAAGGFAGFVGGLLALAIPGIGPILAAGPLAVGIMGGAAGAAVGGLIGGLKSHGVPENDAHMYAEAVRAGRTIVAVHVPHDKASKAADILDDNGALDTAEVAGDATGARGSVTPVPRVSEPVKFTEEDSVRERQREGERRTSIYPGVTGSGSGPNA